MKRKIFYSTLCIFLALLIIFLFYIRFASRKETNLTQGNNLIRVGYNIGNVNYAPFFIAYMKGFFSAHNVKIEVVPLPSSNEVKLALSAGQIDIALAGVTNLFIPISKGVPIKIIAPLASAPTYLFVRPDNKIRTFEDLLGKTIAVSPGGAMDYSIRYVLEKENIDASKINFTNIEKVYRTAALMDKKIVDAVPGGEDELAQYSKIGAILHEEWVSKGYNNLHTPESVVATNEEFELSNPRLVEQFIDALIDGHKFMKSNTEEAAQIVSDYMKKESEGAVVLSLEDIGAIWKNKKLEYSLWYDPMIFVEMSRIAVETGQIESNLTLDQIFDPRFELKLKNAQNEIYSNN
jgi:ABC-type nitrate/sulfonate/bicarbonate transport system substrate-binding protein